MSEGVVFLGFTVLTTAGAGIAIWGLVAVEKARIAALLELERLAAEAEAKKGRDPSPASSDRGGL